MLSNPFTYRQSSPNLQTTNNNPFKLTREPISKQSQSIAEIKKISLDKPFQPQGPVIKAKQLGIFETPINHLKSNYSEHHEFYSQDSQLRQFLDINEQSRNSYFHFSNSMNPDAFTLPVSELKESQQLKDEPFPQPQFNDQSIDQQQNQLLKYSAGPVDKVSIFINDSLTIEPQTQRLSQINATIKKKNIEVKQKLKHPNSSLEENKIQRNMLTQNLSIPNSPNEQNENIIQHILEIEESKNVNMRSKPRIFDNQVPIYCRQLSPQRDIANSSQLDALVQQLQENYDTGRLYLNYFGKKYLQQPQEEIRYFYCNGCEDFIDQRRMENHQQECKNKNIIIEAQLRKVDEKLKKIVNLIENNTKAKSNSDFRRFGYIGIAIIQKVRMEDNPNNLSKYIDDLGKVENSLEQIEADNSINQMIHEAMESIRIKILALL